jgi:hypothetical protein
MILTIPSSLRGQDVFSIFQHPIGLVKGLVAALESYKGRATLGVEQFVVAKHGGSYFPAVVRGRFMRASAPVSRTTFRPRLPGRE